MRAVREAERAAAAAERARTQAVRADARAQAEAKKEAQRLHLASQESKVAAMNSALELQLSEIDGILASTLAVDDYVDLETLRKAVEHPPFESPHSTPTAPPQPIQAPAEPQFVAPEPPKGLSAVFGKKKHAEAVALATAAHEAIHRQWQDAVAAIPMRQLEQMTEHKNAEEERLKRLAEDKAKYDDECRQREAEAQRANDELDALIRDFEAGKAKAVEDYIGIVFGNSVYPEGFPWDVEYEYDESTRELRVDLHFPRPDELPTAKHYKYVRARDEITETAQTQKEQRDRYAGVVHNMTLRTLHEIWESDRTGKIASISLAGGVKHVDPAVGHDTFTPLIALAVDRETFLAIELAKVTPSETLKHLNAVVSLNPHGLVAIDTTQGVRSH
jgi:restriction system protein